MRFQIRNVRRQNSPVRSLLFHRLSQAPVDNLTPRQHSKCAKDFFT